ncbi:MAG: ion channel [Bacteroidia bacterium]
MKRSFFKRFHEEQHTGFSTRSGNQGSRLMNKDGSFNVVRKGMPLLRRLDRFHDMITMPWSTFNTIVIIFYLLINLFFTSLYLMFGVESLGGTIATSPIDKFFEAFFFSCQTYTTVGYGRVNPIGLPANIIASIESLTGLMSFALATGLIYGRFSRPNAKILYSENMVIAPFQNGTALMFRIANARKNQLIECEASLLMSFIEPETQIRKFLPLTLEYNKVTGLAMSWTIVHPINENSPLSGLGPADLNEVDSEFIFMFKAFDDTYAQTIHARYSYSHKELIWGAKFNPAFHSDKNSNATILELDKLGSYEKVELPLVLQKASSE